MAPLSEIPERSGISFFFMPVFIHIFITASSLKYPADDIINSKGQKSEDTGQKSEGTGQKSEGRGQKSEGTGQQSEDTGQKSEDTGQKHADTGQKSRDSSTTDYLYMNDYYTGEKNQ